MFPTSRRRPRRFPCTDLSLAGGRAGLRGSESGLLAEFLRVLEEMGERRPGAVLLEKRLGIRNVQRRSRPSGHARGAERAGLLLRRRGPGRSPLRSAEPPPPVRDRRPRPPGRRPWYGCGSSGVASRRGRPRLLASNGHLRTFSLPVPPVPERAADTLDDVVEAVAPTDGSWWSEERTAAFVSSLSRINIDRAAMLRGSPGLAHATAYRRTRAGKAVWEIRGDNISGCLRDHARGVRASRRWSKGEGATSASGG